MAATHYGKKQGGPASRREGICESALREMDQTVAMSAGNTGMRLCLAINYGSRTELVDACRRIAQEVRGGRLSPEEIGEETIAAHLYTAGMPEPDLLIRTAQGNAREQLPAVADQLCRDLGHRALLAGVRRGLAAHRDSRFRLARPAVRRIGEE